MGKLVESEIDGDVLMSVLSRLLQNIRVMAKYYTRITLIRMAELLDLPVEVSVCVCLSVVGLSVYLNPVFSQYLVVW